MEVEIGTTVYVNAENLISMLNDCNQLFRTVERIAMIVYVPKISDNKFYKLLIPISIAGISNGKSIVSIEYKDLIEQLKCSALYYKYSTNAFKKFMNDFNLSFEKHQIGDIYSLVIKTIKDQGIDKKTGNEFSYYPTYMNKIMETTRTRNLQKYFDIKTLIKEREAIRSKSNMNKIMEERKDDNINFDEIF